MSRAALTLLTVWLAAANLRAAIFALQPVLPDIRRDLGLSFSAAGGLTSMALAALGVASIPGLYVGWRLGARRTVAVMALGIAVASVIRLAPPATLTIFAGSAALAACVAFSQPAVTVLLRQWFASRLQQASGVFSNGILVGGTVGASATPLAAGLTGWRGTFWLWAAVSVAVAAIWWGTTPRTDLRVPRLRVRDALRSLRAWQVTALFTFQNLAYFCVAAWLPFLLAQSSSGYVAWVFTCLNLLPIVPLLVLPALRWSYATSPWFYFGSGLVVVAGAGGLALGLHQLAWALAFLIGLGCAAAFVGAMALAPVIAESDQEAAAITAIVFTFGYILAFAGPLLGGYLVDDTHDVRTGFWPSIGAGAMMTVLGLIVPRLLAPDALETPA